MDPTERSSVQLLRYAHIPKACNTALKAFATDPTDVYNRSSVPAPWWKRGGYSIFNRMFYYFVLLKWMRMGIAFTIDGGTAFVTGSRGTKPGQNSSYFDRIQRFFVRVLAFFRTVEQRSHMAEQVAKSRSMITRVLGDDISDYLCLNVIAVIPEAQGKGYGGALLRRFHAQADKEKREVWLTSSNIKNTNFYVSHGYRVIDEFVLGDSNQTWRREPIVVKMMIRDPQ